MSKLTPLKIDFVSDVACPWCAVGLGALERALETLGGEVQAELHFQPFELNPQMAREGEDIDEHLSKKYGRSPAEFEAARQAIRERGAAVGFTFGQRARIYNTFDAHRLLHWAGLQGRQQQLKKILFRANFTDDANIANHEVLVALAVEAGLDAGQARDVLASGRYAAEVRAAEQLWQSRGINSVPGIVIEGKWLISGGQPPEVFEQALREIAQQAAGSPGSTA